VASRRHGETINLGLNVYDLLRSSLEICNVDFNIEVSDAASRKATLQYARGNSTHLQTIASSSITLKCLAVMMSRLPVVVTNKLERGAASSIVVTS